MDVTPEAADAADPARAASITPARASASATRTAPRPSGELSLEVRAGELVVLIGPSGCGKSTVLRMINRLIEPTAGRILLDDEDVTDVDPVRLRRRIGYVIQNVGLFPHQTVRANVATVPRPARLAQGPDPGPGRRAARPGRAGPGPVRRRYPHELSGGQRQRVGVARALAADPVVLLMDEPFSAVDPIVRARLQEEFLRLQAEVRKTIVLVTHDLDEAVRLGDRIAVLSEGGQLEQYDTPGRAARRARHRRSSASSSAPTGASAGWRSPRSTGRRSTRCPATPRRTCPPSRWTARAYDALAVLLTSGRGPSSW